MAQLPPVLVWLTGLTGVAWVVLELRQSLNSRPEARHGDRGSRVVIGVAAVAGILLAIAAARGLPDLAIGDRVAAGWCGLVLLLAARALRQWASGRSGATSPSRCRPVPTRPSSRAGRTASSGTPHTRPSSSRRRRGGLYVGNWLSLVALVAAVAAGLVYRITVEERALSNDVGAAYREYAATHKRLVPFVW